MRWLFFWEIEARRCTVNYSKHNIVESCTTSLKGKMITELPEFWPYRLYISHHITWNLQLWTVLGARCQAIFFGVQRFGQGPPELMRHKRVKRQELEMKETHKQNEAQNKTKKQTILFNLSKHLRFVTHIPCTKETCDRSWTRETGQKASYELNFRVPSIIIRPLVRFATVTRGESFETPPIWRTSKPFVE